MGLQSSKVDMWEPLLDSVGLVGQLTRTTMSVDPRSCYAIAQQLYNHPDDVSFRSYHKNSWALNVNVLVCTPQGWRFL